MDVTDWNSNHSEKLKCYWKKLRITTSLAQHLGGEGGIWVFISNIWVFLSYFLLSMLIDKRKIAEKTAYKDFNRSPSRSKSSSVPYCILRNIHLPTRADICMLKMFLVTKTIFWAIHICQDYNINDVDIHFSLWETHLDKNIFSTYNCPPGWTNKEEKIKTTFFSSFPVQHPASSRLGRVYRYIF